MKTFLRLFGSVLGVLLLASGAFALNYFKSNNLVLPRTMLGDINLTGLTYDQTRERVRERLNNYAQAPIQIAARGEVQEVTLKDLGIVLNEAVVLRSIPFARSMSNPEILLWSIAGRRVIPNVSVERTELLKAIYDKFPSIPKTKNAYIVLEKKKMKVVDAVQGVTPNIDPLVKLVKKNVTFLESSPLFVEFLEEPPTILALDLEEHMNLILKNFPKNIKLNSDVKKWSIDFENHPEWIVFERKPYAVTDGEMPFSLSFDSIAFAEFVSTNLTKTLEQEPEGAKIWKDEKGKVNFDGSGTDGKRIENEELLSRINQSIMNLGEEVEIPVAVLAAKIEISDELRQLGVQDILSIGYTRFDGSPVNRSYNIATSIDKFNGILIPPGEVFSFGNSLGPVDGSTGYRKELVIKPEGTIPEYGGGVCQVSSTIYRAALFAGLPIVERRPHSYAVSYYALVGGHGLDATVYPPSPDLKFKNDTKGHILIQSYVDGYSAYFKFYGTKDERVVEMEGPYISNQRSAPSEPVLIPDSSLAPGQRKQVEKARGGFDATWYRHLTINGETKKEPIISKYRAVPNKYLVGDQVDPTLDSPGVSVNPYE